MILLHGIELESPGLVNARKAGTMLRESVSEWTTKWTAEGLTKGRAKVMRRQAARKFGPETAERLVGRLATIAGPERAVEVGKWLLECESGEELLARVEGLCEPSAAGNGAPPG